MVNRLLVDHFRCPEQVGKYRLSDQLSDHPGYFRFGDHIICYGQLAGGRPSSSPTEPLCNVPEDMCAGGIPSAQLLFNPEQVIDNLRRERYVTDPVGHPSRQFLATVIRKAYYGIRPFLPVSVRKHLQKAYLRGRQSAPFPHWPVDSTVEAIFEKLLSFPLKAQKMDRIPFIWFWPDGASACMIMTHDVETASGRDFCPHLMDMDDQHGIKASFQIVPQQRYNTSPAFMDTMRSRGFEINVHDLNHDGYLYSNEDEFLRRVKSINQYGRQFGAHGFRSAVLYRKPDWYHALAFDYDMSIPNAAHMDPQPGGCCTVFPYFIGDILEIPVTTIQDYSLFHILGEYSIELWKRQIGIILGKYGLASFIVHPDYVIEQYAREVYMQLLAYVTRVAAERNVWLALPGQVSHWWRERSQMTLVEGEGGWRIEGPGKEKARIAYASLHPAGGIQYAIESIPASGSRRGNHPYIVPHC